ncbi:hypothetical protein LSAT2_013779, partial [Lamellibrachia satsuma]
MHIEKLSACIIGFALHPARVHLAVTVYLIFPVSTRDALGQLGRTGRRPSLCATCFPESLKAVTRKAEGRNQWVLHLAATNDSGTGEREMKRRKGSGLDGITLYVAALTKWMYTESLTAAVSSQLKSMLHLNSANPHHECGQTCVARDAGIVLSDANSGNKPIHNNELYFNQYINMTTEQEVEHHLTNVKELGPSSLHDSMSA